MEPHTLNGTGRGTRSETRPFWDTFKTSGIQVGRQRRDNDKERETERCEETNLKER